MPTISTLIKKGKYLDAAITGLIEIGVNVFLMPYICFWALRTLNLIPDYNGISYGTNRTRANKC
jgi:hypothetical protein